MPAEPFLSVIVTSYDGRELLRDCLASLEAQSYPADRFEVVVVDNGSTDGTAEWVKANHPQTVLVREPHNLGFAEGTNRGAAAAKGDFLVFVNNDAVAAPTFLAELVRAAGSDAIGAVAGRILDWEGRAVEFGGGCLNIFGVGFGRPCWHPDFLEAAPGADVPFACGAAMLARTDVFRSLGGFDPDFFAFYEDVDLGWRFWLSGHRVVYAPSAQVRHRGHATARRFSDRWRHFQWFRNTLQTLVKNSEDRYLPRLLPLTLSMGFSRVGMLYQAAADARTAGDAERAEGYLDCAVGGGEGIRWVLTHVDELLAKRRVVQQRRRLSDRELGERFGLELDFGPEAGEGENALALRLSQLIDLSDLLAPERLESAAAVATARLLDALSRLADQTHRVDQLDRQLDQRNREAQQFERDLDMRNHEAERLDRDLDAQNREVGRLGRDLDSRNRDVECLRREVAQLAALLEDADRARQQLQARLDNLLSSRSWRWSAPLRRLLDRRPRAKDR